jgi:drug/metabolite transporter (DMT)-like permease
MNFFNVRISPIALAVFSAFLNSLLIIFTLRVSSIASWQMTAFFRTAIGFILVILFLHILKLKFTWRVPREIWIRSMGGSVALLLNFYAFQRLSAAESSLFTATVPLWLTVYSFFQGKESKRFRVISAVLIFSALFGIFLAQKTLIQSGNYAGLACLFSTLIVAIIILIVDRVITVHPLVVTGHHFLVTAIVSSVFLFNSGLEYELSREFLLIILFMALIAITAQMAGVRAYQLGNKQSVSASTNSIIVFSGIYDYSIQGQIPNTWNPIGFLAITVPILIFSIRKKFRKLGLVSYSDRELERIESAIANAESRTSCEFRIAFEPQKSAEPEDKAIQVFNVNEMSSTKRRNAILIYMSNSGGAVVFDEGIHNKVPKELISNLKEKILAILNQSHSISAIREILHLMTKILEVYFPKEDTENELADSLLTIDSSIGSLQV